VAGFVAGGASAGGGGNSGALAIKAGGACRLGSVGAAGCCAVEAKRPQDQHVGSVGLVVYVGSVGLVVYVGSVGLVVYVGSVGLVVYVSSVCW